jgi:hypothetical protein
VKQTIRGAHPLVGFSEKEAWIVEGGWQLVASIKFDLTILFDPPGQVTVNVTV